MPEKDMIILRVSRRELATILAALRYHQDENLQGSGVIPDRLVQEIASQAGTLRPLDFEEVSTLCNRLESG